MDNLCNVCSLCKANAAVIREVGKDIIGVVAIWGMANNRLYRDSTPITYIGIGVSLFMLYKYSQ